MRHRAAGLSAALDSLRLAPDDDSLRYDVAERLHASNALDEAMAVLAEVLRRKPGWAAAHQLMGIVLADIGRMSAAIGQFRRVTTLAPDAAGGWANLGAMLKVEGRFDASLKAYDRAIALAPDDARIRVNRTVALLHAGRLQDAWTEFEWRLALGDPTGLGTDRLMPALSQCGDLDGRTVLVTHEEGFGDTLQFLRYLPLLAGRGARVLVWVPKPLERVLQSVAGVAEVLSGNIAVPAFDFHCPFVSLPRVFDTCLATIPNSVPYIAVDPTLASDWAKRVPSNGMLVGLAWAGQGRPSLPGFDVVDARRSMPLATLAPLAAVQGARLVSLQMGPAADQALCPPPGLVLSDLMAEVTDFADTAAIISNLDIVVTVDTSVVHLAGAMGKPVLLLDRYDNCWRWLSGRVDSPWYPTLRIFRQKQLGQWGPVVTRVAAALSDAVARRQ
jgi:hypothetical protein